jgi:uncharacterized membrane protein
MVRRDRARSAGRRAYRTIFDVLFTGFAVIVPLVITLYVIQAALGFVGGALSPVVKLLQAMGLIEGVKQLGFVQLLISVGIYQDVTTFITELTAVFILGIVVIMVGLVARHRHGEVAIDTFDYFLASIPGIGSVYKSFRRMGDVMMESDVENFREVKLVEFPRDGTFVLGFVTNDAPGAVVSAIDESDAVEGESDTGDVVTMFLPLAPNPVMGGFLAHVPKERLIDVDMTVREGIRSIITSGVASEDADIGQSPDIDLETVERVKRRRDDAVELIRAHGDDAIQRVRERRTDDQSERREGADRERQAEEGRDGRN